MNNKGLWLILQALDQQEEDSTVEKNERTNNASPGQEKLRTIEADHLQRNTISTDNKLNKVNYGNLQRGDLMNDKISLCCFFFSFGVVISKPLEYFCQVEKDGKLISRKVKKPLPTKFMRMAAALVVHHR